MAVVPFIAFLIAFSNVSLILRAPDVAMGTYGSLLASVCAVVASVLGVIALVEHRAYRTAMALNVVATFFGAMDFLAAASKYGHPQLANILATLSAAVCGGTVPLLLRSKRRRTIH